MALPLCHKAAAAVFPVQWIGRNRGLIAPAISFRFRHSRQTGKILPVNVAAIAAGWRFFLRFLQEKYYPVLDRQEARADRMGDKGISAIKKENLLCTLGALISYS